MANYLQIFNRRFQVLLIVYLVFCFPNKGFAIKNGSSVSQSTSAAKNNSTAFKADPLRGLDQTRFTWLPLLSNFDYRVTDFIQRVDEITITGTVTGNDNDPLPGVNVKVKGGTEATATDNKGHFILKIKNPKATLVFTEIGFKTIEQPVNGLATLNVTMQPAVNDLTEVVINGYGSTTKRNLITSIGTADIKDMQKAPVPAFDQMLAGRIAGVNVVSDDGQPGAASTFTIRGPSVSQDSSPLFVVDGLAIENMDINSINPQDIASLEVLKDPASVAIYGSRGSNGVILITTKRGISGSPKVSYSYNRNYQKITKRIPLMSPYDFVKLQLELDSIQSTPSNPVTTFHQIYLDPTKGIDLNYYKTAQGYDWQDLVLRTGITQSHALNISGGDSTTRYYISGNAYNQDGIVINTGLNRYDGRISVDQKIGKNLHTGISGSYSSTTSYGTIAVSSPSGGVIQGVWQYRPVSGTGNQNLANNLIDSLALQSFFNGNSSSTLGDNLVNPLIQAQNEFRNTVTNTSYLNAFADYRFSQHLTLHLSGGYGSTLVTQKQFYNSQTQQGNLFVNSAGAIANTSGINGQVQTSNAQNYSTSNTLNYNIAFGKNQIDAIAGVEYQYAEQLGTSLRAINIPLAVEDLGILSLGSGTPSTAQLQATRNQLYSAFGRVNYNYAGKYYLMGSLRSDGSSKFAPGKQWGYFPAAAAAWNFSEEKFFEPLKSIIDFAKLRVSWGSTGNNKVGDFAYESGWVQQNSRGYAWNNVNVGGIVPFAYPNSALTWETTTGADYGLNLNFFDSRISTEAVYYQKTTKNFLLGVRLPYSAGYPNGANAQYENTGRLSNNGFEFTLNTINIRSKNFSWTTNFNIAFNTNKILEFYNGLDNIQTTWSLPGSAATTAWIAKVGGPVSEFYGYIWNGVYQYSDFNKLANGTYTLKSGVPTYSANVQPGDPKYKDINGDGVVDGNDVTTLGSPLPIHTGGFTNDFTYKNFSLNVFFQWSYGNKILNANTVVFDTNGGYDANYNQYADYANRWTPTNPSNDIPRARIGKGDAGTQGARVSSRDVEDGSFLRLKTVQLSYTVPRKILDRLKISNLQFNVSAQNLLTFTKYSGMDPEVSTARTSNSANSPFGGSNNGSTSSGGAGYTFIQSSSGYPALQGGYDYTPYPRALIINLGANVTF